MSFEFSHEVLLKYHHELGTTTLSFPEDVREIAKGSIGTNQELTRIIIHDTIRRIDEHVFYDCWNLKSIQVSEKNRYFSDIDGVMYDRNKHILLWCPNALEHLHIPAGVNRIEEMEAFAGCHQLKKITVDHNHWKYTVLNGVLYEHNGFTLTKLIRCPVDIQELHIPESVTEIFPHAFRHCTELKEITIPERVTEIKNSTFKNCQQLSSIHLHSRISHIRYMAFSGCRSLKEIILPHGITEVEPHAFSYCNNLKKLVIPESITDFEYIGGVRYDFDSVNCHGIEIPVHQCRDVNDVIRMIIRYDFKQEISPAVKYPVLCQMFFKDQDNSQIRQYIQEHFIEIMAVLIQQNQAEIIEKLLVPFGEYLTAQNLDEFIRLAIDEQKYEIQIFLTNLKYQCNGFSPKDWSL